jgi:hypothetical protein
MMKIVQYFGGLAIVFFGAGLISAGGNLWMTIVGGAVIGFGYSMGYAARSRP